MKRVILTLFVAWAAIFSLDAQPISIVFVDADATGNNDGSSWADAYTRLDSALATQQAAFVQVWVAEGVYKPTNAPGRNAMFNLRANIYGGFNGTETTLSQRDPKNNLTVLSGDVLGNDTGRATAGNPSRSDNLTTILEVPVNGSTVIDGFVFEGGHANSAAGAGWENYAGAAIVAKNNLLDIKNCVFRNNYGYRGVLALGKGTGSNGFTTVDKCEFYGNEGVYMIERRDLGSQGVNYIHEIYITNNLFHQNTLIDSSTGDAHPGMIRAHIYYSAGFNYYGASADYYIFHNTFVSNEMSSEGCILSYASNSFPNGFNQRLHWYFVGNLMAYNTGETETVEADVNNLSPTAQAILLGNVVTHNDSTGFNYFVASGFNDLHRFMIDPMFTDTANNDYTINSCLSGVNDISTYTANNNTVAQLLETDFNGNPRATGASYDAGAFEIQTQATPITATQSGSQLIADPGYDAYGWFFLTTPQPVPLPDTTNVITPTNGDGWYLAAARDANGCNTNDSVFFCGSVQVSISEVGDSLVASGSVNYQWYKDGQSISGATSASIMPTGNGTYEVRSWDPNDPNGCTGSAVFKYCGDLVEPVITRNQNTLSIQIGYEKIQWLENGTPIPGANGTIYTPSGNGIFSVTVEDTSAACTKTSADFNFGTTSIGSVVDAGINVFPNPATNFVKIHLNGFEATQIQVMNLAGQVVSRQDGLQTKLDVSNLPKGLYLIKISNAQERYLHKLAVQ